MIIIRNTSDYIVYSEDEIINALKKIEKNKSGLVFLTNHHGELNGVFTDGDFRRWAITQNKIDLTIKVCEVSRDEFTFVREGMSLDKIQKKFSDVIKLIPILDKNNHLLSIAQSAPSGIQIGPHVINKIMPSFIIAEIGVNHNGSMELAKEMVDKALWAGADCAKFQMRHLKELYQNEGNPNDLNEDLGSQYILDVLARSQLTREEMLEIFDYCRSKNIIPLCTPWDIPSLKILEEYGMDAYKVASADLTNHDLIETIAKTGKPIILSTGMSTEKEIIETVDVLKRLGAPYILLNCNSTYPAPFKDVNLQYFDRLKEIGDCLIGYSGHERGLNIALAAIAFGAKVIEKHFTLDKDMEGNDHKISLLPKEFKSMVEGIRQIEEAMGTDSERVIGPGERMNRESLAKSMIASCDIKTGDVIAENMIQIKGPGKGLQPNRRADLVNTVARREIMSGDFFYPMDLGEGTVVPKNYNFKRPWGLPARYHDFDRLRKKTNMNFLEFHLSYKDLEQDVDSFFSEPLDLGLVVHCPELFTGDHLLNLASEDATYRKRSIVELQKVIGVTQALKPYFNQSDPVLIVVNVGGFTKDKALQPEKRVQLYEIVAESLSKLETNGIEIIPQTMPPFPWLFGGQFFHNLFINPKETVLFCQNYGYRVCLDTSHSQLAVNYEKSSLEEFVDLVGPYVGHLHLVDAEGLDDEGVQIGDGEINFSMLSDKLAKLAPQAGFIPEIWQGHTNEGEGFWLALERLEQWF
jgi:sialic acid synthase SpsE/sugar phosphate isomerase/epimerase